MRIRLSAPAPRALLVLPVLLAQAQRLRSLRAAARRTTAERFRSSPVDGVGARVHRVEAAPRLDAQRAGERSFMAYLRELLEGTAGR